jgi:hypothetical protein
MIKDFASFINESESISKISLKEIKDHEDEYGDIKSANLRIEYQTRINGAFACLESPEFMDGNYIETDYWSDDPEWYKEMYHDGKQGKEIVDRFLEIDAIDYLMTKNFTINSEKYNENENYEAEEDDITS